MSYTGKRCHGSSSPTASIGNINEVREMKEKNMVLSVTSINTFRLSDSA